MQKPWRHQLLAQTVLFALTFLGARGPAAEVSPNQAGPITETWEVVQLNGSDVGYVHVEQTDARRGDRDVAMTVSTTFMRMKRFGQTVTQRLRIVSTELPSGKLLDFGSEFGSGAVELNVRGRVAGKQLQLTVTSGEQQDHQVLAWNDAYGSPFAVERSLRESPPREGERRELHMLMPVFNQVAKVTLVAEAMQPVELLDDTRELRQVICHTELPGGETLTSRLWIDVAGEIWKSTVEGIGQTTYRATKSRALRAGLGEFDLGDYTVVRLSKTPPDFADAKSVTYRAELAGEDPRDLFPSDDRQQVAKLGEPDAVLIVTRRTPAPATSQPRHAPEDLAANSLIQTGDARLRGLAERIARVERDPAKIAQELCMFVHRNMKSRDESQALASAAEVAESLEGDCTEHAMLLVGLCRVRGIPARVAIGLVYAPTLGGFAYHMWSEAWVADRWVSLDATRPTGKVGAGHLKMAVSNLNGISPYEAFLPVMKAMGRLQLEVVSSQ